MAKDHFQDIIPPQEPRRTMMSASRAMPDRSDDEGESMTITSSDKSIRNINITRRAVPADTGRAGPRRRSSRFLLWILACVCVLVLALLAILYVFRNTSVIVVPHVQSVTFDSTVQYTAYPAAFAASGTVPYVVQTTDFDDSEPVQANGTTHEEQKASGSIAVINDYSTGAVTFVKNTRFETSSGLVFRTPEAVSIPGKQGSTPGKVTITVVADSAGAQYNIGPGQKLTVPGLESNAAMYAGVYATTAASTTGGFLGDAPAVSDSDMQSAVAAMQARLQQKAQSFATAQTDGIALQPIITYTSEQPAQSGTSTVTVNETAHVVVPVVATAALSAAVAQAVTADASAVPYMLVPSAGFAATPIDESAVPGTDPITFTLSGAATLVAQIDANGLASALAGRSSAAFQNIVSNFPGVDSAHARIEPFWQNSFPNDPADIHVVIQAPTDSGH